MTAGERCPACGGGMALRLEPWLRWCAACGLWRSSLAGGGRLQPSQVLDEELRARGLSSLRQDNHRRALRALARVAGPLRERRLLDVGCAHGWFLRAAQDSGMTTLGIEPDREIGAQAAAAGCDVRVGYFPGDAPDEEFDVVSFNDVLEHVDDLDAALAASARLLRAGGVLLVSAPDARGVLYRTACLMARAGRRGPLHRLWQKGFPSPHLSYFSTASLHLLARGHGFQPIGSEPLRSFQLRGLWSRIHFDRRPSAASFLTYLALVIALPALARLFPSDQRLHLFRRPVN